MINVCELFAGVGGFRVGLEKSSQEYNLYGQINGNHQENFNMHIIVM